MKATKKHLALIALVAVLLVSNITFAVLYMTRNVEITAGVSAVGSIQIYQEDGVTPLTNFTIPKFAPGVLDNTTNPFWINNTGNTPVSVYWNMSASSIVWSGYTPIPDFFMYRHYEDGVEKYWCVVDNFLSAGWMPWPDMPLVLDVGEGVKCNFHLAYSGKVTTAEEFTMTLSFYALDS